MINNYIDRINKRFKMGISTEHTFRGDLQIFLESFDKSVVATNEPTRIECGAPDYIITKNDIPIGYIEAKDIGISLKKSDKTDQLKRYKSSLDNLILTDYLDFWLYRNGKFILSVAIAEISNQKIEPLFQNFKDFENLINTFYTHISQSITSAPLLAEMMASKAKMMQSVMEKALSGDQKNEQDSSLKSQMSAFQKILIHDIKSSEFADIYAQTIAYGMFSARLHDKSLDHFSRQKAAELIPKSNPFLRRLFGYIAGPDIDDRIKWIVDDLADIFRATNLSTLMKNIGSSTQMNDPVIHFYETFLAKYNPKLRKSRGVWYTPEPVVNFIVRAVDDILKTEFGLAQGLADTSKIQIKVKEQGVAKSKVTKEVHKVQILDPATGTGTFLAEVVNQIHKKFEGQQGIWSKYVEDHLIPRLNGFEILMASYAMAHLKLDLLLSETGYKPKKQNRFRIFLTNSLEEAHPDTATLFTTWLSDEATEANLIKRDTPVMVILGNPPYSVSSINKGEWIQNLIKDYKKNLNERKINLDDDYIKFIRYGQYFIDKNRGGILAYISNNSFIDGITHRQMRKHLLETFDKIYILDLHGNSRKREVSPDGSLDQNVFDIMAGVSINIYVKTNQKKKNILGKIYHSNLFGKREVKYKFLHSNSFQSIKWCKLDFRKPYYFFVPKNFNLASEYESGYKLNKFFTFNNSGFETAKDKFIIKYTKKEIDELKNEILEKNATELSERYGVKISKIEEVKSDINNSHSINILYRPFDERFTLISQNSKGVMFRPRFETVRHLFKKNVGLLCCKRQTSFDFQHTFVTDKAVERCSVSLQTGEVSYVFPLYLYPDTNQQTFDNDTERKPNLNIDIVKQIAKFLKLTFTPEKEKAKNTFAPIDILDYIYAVLHSPTYREKYKEFLKIDFPRVPYPKDKKTFQQLVKLGGELRSIHLLESPKVEQYITTYPQDGDNIITRRIMKKDYEIIDTEKQLGRVWINEQQYFENIPKTVWEFYIGGYQPAQKWLKDRKERELSFEDIMHYQKIIVTLDQTGQLMKKIDEVKF